MQGLNTHGLSINYSTLGAACRSTRCLNPFEQVCDCYYDLKTGRFWCRIRSVSEAPPECPLDVYLFVSAYRRVTRQEMIDYLFDYLCTMELIS